MIILTISKFFVQCNMSTISYPTAVLTVTIGCSDVSDLLVRSRAQNLDDGFFIGTSTLHIAVTILVNVVKLKKKMIKSQITRAEYDKQVLMMQQQKVQTV